MRKRIGILTSGGDCQGLNAAIRGVCKAGQESYGMSFLGFRNGFRGLVEDNTMELESGMLSGILTHGGTILGTSRDKPHRMPSKNGTRDMTSEAVKTFRKHRLEALVCIGGGGTQKNALVLKNAGLNVITLPKTIDNDLAMTDASFGFDTALGIATEAIDRLHSTAMSHDRIIVVELMGHRAGWLALGAGLAGGADVILIPEIPYRIEKTAAAILARKKAGKHFSIVAVAEGAMSKQQEKLVSRLVSAKGKASSKEEKNRARAELDRFHFEHLSHTLELTRNLEKLTGVESRLTILGHLQRGGTPSAYDRILATRLGSACTEFLDRKRYGIMVASKGEKAEAVPLEEVAGKKNLVPPDHPWVKSAREIGTSLGD
ncbi:MAG TPA: ATP-dependent 6-phosphofructokinase [Acidobacteriota bacterium]|nr:ATP-dependent 6-phosphofructokinase [Acidobacteriota bacterium]HNT17671.1 ATP-dependent 6-phosphofructokinase [Acidobacteriota bacterium]HPA27060.1 ATP-dependent 6-phosphofructokinase [Acidobacteriota bacterium]HQO20442.1 ATP-dependent 6-phosphofructokinase [Acidobacteriota bacterium]HQQ47254.1 ATP-dependent 6-phosphofructokinase [Acidobacteriota bacterium]